MKTIITPSSIKALRPENKPYFLWDSSTRGFGVLVNPKGKISYVAQARVKGKLIRRTIGTVGGTPFKVARSHAEAALLDMRKDTDLLERVVEKSRQVKAGKTEITVAELIDRFLSDYAYLHCKPRTAETYKISLENHFLPKFGTRKINRVTRSDMRQLHSSLKKTPYAANRMLAAVSKMYNQARIWELCDGLENPCQGIQKNPEKQKDRYLKREELICLHAALDDEEAIAPMAIAAFRLLLYTGARRGEIQTLKWEYINGNQINLPDSKTGKKSIYLTPKAREIINAIPRKNDNDYVISGREPESHLIGFKKPWRRVRERATLYIIRDYSGNKLAKLVADLEKRHEGLPSLAQCRKEAEKRNLHFPVGLMDFRIHDLRHNFASQMVMRGEGLALVKEMLGHKRIETTARYAHLDTNAVQEALERNSDAFEVDDEVRHASG